jgi:hypothetical protein
MHSTGSRPTPLPRHDTAANAIESGHEQRPPYLGWQTPDSIVENHQVGGLPGRIGHRAVVCLKINRRHRLLNSVYATPTPDAYITQINGSSRCIVEGVICNQEALQTHEHQPSTCCLACRVAPETSDPRLVHGLPNAGRCIQSA